MNKNPFFTIIYITLLRTRIGKRLETGSKGMVLEFNTLQKWFKATASKIGIDTNQSGKRFTNHAQRSTLVTLSVGAGAAPAEAIGLTGHRNIQSIVPYVNPQLKRRSELKDKAFEFAASPPPEKQLLGVPSPQPETQLLGVHSPQSEKQVIGCSFSTT